MKLVKKIIFKIFLLFLIISVIYFAGFYIKNYFIDKSSYSINNHVPIDEYEKMYPIDDYVSESFETVGIYKNSIIKSMYKYDEIANKSIWSSFLILSKNLIFNRESFLADAKKAQYNEENLIYLEDVLDDETHNYQIIATDENGEEVRINLALFGNYKHNITISFLDTNGNIDSKKAKVLADDSNSEMLAYLIVKETQKELGTNLEPNEASKEYFGTSLERLAGDISYHSIVAYILSYYNISDKPLLYEKVQNINIAVNDNDSVFMNRPY